MHRQTPSLSKLSDVVLVALLGVAVRGLFLLLCGPHLYGDGIGYPNQGMLIATGQGVGSEVDATWLGAISYWMAGIYVFLRSVLWTGIVGSFLPGILLIVLVQLAARRLAGRAAGILAGLFCVFQPLLVTYSINGYMEMFYCTCLLIAMLAAIFVLQRSSLSGAKWQLVVCGVGMALAFATRNEALPLALAFLVLPVCARASLKERLRAIGTASLAFLLTLILYVGMSYGLTGEIGLFGKMENFSRHSDVYLEREAAANEIYGAGGMLQQVNGEVPRVEQEAVGMQLGTICRRFFSKAFRVLPSVAIRLFASPLPLLAVIPLLGWLCRRGWQRAYLPVCGMALFFPLFFTAYALEPRYLMPMMMPVQLLAAVGLMQLVRWKPCKKFARPILLGTAGTVLLILCAGTVWKGQGMREDRDMHQNLAAWLQEELAADQVLTGCGFGYITATTFRSGHSSFSRLQTDDVATLEAFVRERTDGWLILYEGYLADTNPALLPYLEAPLPGFQLRYEVADVPGRRARIFELDEPEPEAAGSP